MTGVLNSMAGQVGGLRYTVTVEHSGGSPGSYGYNTGGPYGSISSTAFLGRTIITAHSNQQAGQYAFTFGLNYSGSELPTDFFQAVWVHGTDGSWKTYRTSDAFFSLNLWSWDQVGDKPWTGTSPSTRDIIVVP